MSGTLKIPYFEMCRFLKASTILSCGCRVIGEVTNKLLFINNFGKRQFSSVTVGDNANVHISVPADVRHSLPPIRSGRVLQDNIANTSSDITELLEPCIDDVSDVAPYFPPTFNFASYVNKSPTLQELVKLGVDLYVWEQKKGIPQFVLKLDFEKDIKTYLTLLHDVGVPSSSLGKFLTKNPLIFKETVDDLHVRVNYLLSKKFTTEMIARIVTLNPYWLSFSTERIDRRLGYFQKNFDLSGNQVRELTAKQPRLITYNMYHLNLNTFAIKEELGFNNQEVQTILLRRPRIWMMGNKSLIYRFSFVHNEMKVPHELICLQPEVLGSREFRTKQRHLFLSFLGKAQYDPRSEGYISLKSLVSGTDAEFCINVAKSSVDAFNLFLKTL